MATAVHFETGAGRPLSSEWSRAGRGTSALRERHGRDRYRGRMAGPKKDRRVLDRRDDWRNGRPRIDDAALAATGERPTVRSALRLRPAGKGRSFEWAS